MKKNLVFIVFAFLIFGNLSAQNTSGFGVKLSGFIRTDVIYDSRQSTPSYGLREGHFYLFPENVSLDADSVDINDHSSFHILSIQTRLRGDVTGPDAFGAKTSGVIEAEFFGTSEADLNGFRLRHGFTKLDWKKVSLLIGQTWHPIFPAECFPGTVSFNTGAPFTPFARNPQIKLTYNPGKLSATLTAYSERDFTSTGPDGPSNKYMRNSGLPGFNGQIKVPFGGFGFFIVGGDYKTLRPELRTAANYENPNTLIGISRFATLHLKTKPVSMTLMASHIENATDMVMLGGYGVADIIDPITGVRTFSSLSATSAWLDLYTNGKKLQAGLFAGFSKNFGSDKELNGPIFGRGVDIDMLARISPRVLVTREKLTIAAEMETTIAYFGTVDNYGRVKDSAPVTNFRLLIAAIYKF
jgi:hypothetical protein